MPDIEPSKPPKTAVRDCATLASCQPAIAVSVIHANPPIASSVLTSRALSQVTWLLCAGDPPDIGANGAEPPDTPGHRRRPVGNPFRHRHFQLLSLPTYPNLLPSSCPSFSHQATILKTPRRRQHQQQSSTTFDQHSRHPSANRIPCGESPSLVVIRSPATRVVPIHRRFAGNPNKLKMAVGLIKSSVLNGPASFACRANIDTNRFDDLVLALRQALGPSSGLTSDDVDVDHLNRLMRDYASDPREWTRFAMGDESRGYTRNLVDEGNGKSNLVGWG
jgi:hypothetical protein